MPSRPDNPGYELPLLLFGGFRTLIDELHARLREQGHPDARPVHGFAMQAIGVDGATASEVGRRLGVSKQAAGKTIDGLERLGYVARTADEHDARRKLVVLTDDGIDVLRRSAEIFDELRASWVRTLGAERLRAMETDLRTVVGAHAYRLDAQAWFGA
ncbi:MarR family winged helix-turn-helix transcriptional regulator [Solicola gregarius]|uniref:MarR family winged helix-turn-helix transcriptional regulator n=1 Tax=Solicola gregarius TaxID=2908642 RepID=A0AA46TF37_9ACTN|nr:MarR family winged helix-turn-helix transcriptional regulator [Solicola gregarius]UYM03709.1 MarR family winged helix-turn-helix transcriptional regulator [Solicola gregarius]